MPQNAALIGDGRFELRIERAHFCRATDACVGSFLTHRERFATLEEADARADELACREDDEEGVSVRDLEPPVLVAEPIEEGDIPF